MVNELRRSLHNLFAVLRRHDRRLPECETWVQRPQEPARLIAVDLALLTTFVTVIIVLVFRLWDAHMRVPFAYTSDGLGAARDVKTIVETGWVQTNPRLGAPFGQQVYDYPISGDNGNYLFTRLMAIFTSDWALILNVFLLLTFYTAAWSAYVCLRWLRSGRTSSIVCALLFAFAPYHFGEGAVHLMLSSYFVVPIAVLLSVRAASGQPLIARRVDVGPEMSWRGKALFHLGSTLPWVVMCVACASFGPYYSFFTMVTVGMTTLVVAATHRTIRPVLAGASYGIVVVGMFIFNLLPNLLYRAEHGVNTFVAKRVPIELDLYGLRLIQLVTPVPGHWWSPLESASEELSQGYTSAGAQFLGLVGAASLLLMLGWLAGVIVRSDRSPRDDARAVLAIVTMAWILIATTGGLSWFVTLIGFLQIRVWSRVSILLVFTSLAWLCLTIAPKVRRWVGDSEARRRIAYGLAITVLVFGLADQTSANFVPKPNAYVDSFVSDKAFFTAVEQQLPEAAMVYQLPYRRFPEEPPLFGSGDYDLLRPYLQTEWLRWSYGGMKGRESDWQIKLANLPADQLTRAVLAIGYQAYVIDRAGYPDSGAQIEGAISAAIGRNAVQSPDGRWSFFDLTDLEARFGTTADLAALRDHLLNSPRLDTEGCSGPEGAGADQFNWCSTSGTFHVIDPTPDESQNVLRASVIAPGGPGVLRLTIAAKTTVVAIGPDATPISLILPPGRDIAIGFSTDVPAVIASADSRDLRFQLVFPQVTSSR